MPNTAPSAILRRTVIRAIEAKGQSKKCEKQPIDKRISSLATKRPQSVFVGGFLV
jgi:hypothetical protein